MSSCRLSWSLPCTCRRIHRRPHPGSTADCARACGGALAPQPRTGNRSHRRSTAVSGRRAAVPRRRHAGPGGPGSRDASAFAPTHVLTLRRWPPWPDPGLLISLPLTGRTALTRPVRLRAKAHASKRVDTHTSQAGGARADLPRAQRLSLFESGSDSDSSQTSTRKGEIGSESESYARAPPLLGGDPARSQGVGEPAPTYRLSRPCQRPWTGRLSCIHSAACTYFFRGGEGAVAAAHSLPCCRFMMRSSISGRKARMRPCTGHAAASPSAQIVCPSIW